MVLDIATLITSFIALVLFYYWYHSTKSHNDRLPPGPPRLPVVGSLPFLGADIREPLRKMTKKYGDIMTVYLGQRRVVMLNSHDVIKEAFVKRGHSFAGRPQDLFLLSELCGSIGVISSEGQLWQEQRRFTHTVLKDLGMGRGVLEPKITEEIKEYLAVLEDTKEKPTYPLHVTMRAIANIIWSIVTGSRCNYDDPWFNKYLSNLEFVCDSISHSGVVMILPFLRHLPGDPFSIKQILNVTKEGTDGFLDLIRTRKDSYDPDNMENFIDNYLKEMKEKEKEPGSTFYDIQLAQVIGDLFGAGTETTSSTILWCIAFMLRYPDVMARCQREIDDVIGRHRAPSMKDKASMPYTEATLLEVQRVATIAAFGVPHRTLEEVELRGYILPCGTEVMGNAYAVHRDPVTWPEPEVFKPTRHLTDDGKIYKREQLIPFSIGRRACVGESLAKMELFLFFTSLLQRFHLVSPEGEKPPAEVGKVGATHTPHKFNVIFKLRQ